MADEVTFYNTEGVAYTTSDPSEIIRLSLGRSHYLSPEVAADPAAADEDPRFHSGDHNVADVLSYLDEHPEDVERVHAEERAGKARTTILGE